MGVKHKLGLATYDVMNAEQDGLCKICLRPESLKIKGLKMKLCVDHDHETGAVRDLLCARCNRILGYVKEDPALLRAMANYIERHKKDPRPIILRFRKKQERDQDPAFAAKVSEGLKSWWASLTPKDKKQRLERIHRGMRRAREARG